VQGFNARINCEKRDSWGRLEQADLFAASRVTFLPVGQCHMKPNSQYNMARPEGIITRITTYQRRRIYQRFLRAAAMNVCDSILDVGVTSDRGYQHSNYLEAWYPHKHSIMAVGIDDASFLSSEYPGMRFVRGNGLMLPFRDRSFDIVHSSAVIEHIGSVQNQTKFIAECARVSRRLIFITTPNRWFPIELHTMLPLIHWCPPPLFRLILRQMSLEFFAQEANLNLMSAADLRSRTVSVAAFDFTVSGVSLFGWTSNLLLVGVRKKDF
jgi:Methyltransferase domain